MVLTPTPTFQTLFRSNGSFLREMCRALPLCHSCSTVPWYFVYGTCTYLVRSTRYSVLVQRMSSSVKSRHRHGAIAARQNKRKNFTITITSTIPIDHLRVCGHWTFHFHIPKTRTLTLDCFQIICQDDEISQNNIDFVAVPAAGSSRICICARCYSAV